MELTERLTLEHYEHYFLINASYSPRVSEGLNRRRLDISRNTVIPALAGQSDTGFSVILRVHPDDPLLDERLEAFSAVPRLLDVRYDLHGVEGVDDATDLPTSRNKWERAVDAMMRLDLYGVVKDYALTTRIDDDDSITTDFVERLHRKVGSLLRYPVWLSFPNGYRVGGWRQQPTRKVDNQFISGLFGRPWRTARSVNHGEKFLKRLAPIEIVDARPAWAWSIHGDSVSYHRGKRYKMNMGINRMWKQFPKGVRFQVLRHEYKQDFVNDTLTRSGDER